MAGVAVAVAIHTTPSPNGLLDSEQFPNIASTNPKYQEIPLLMVPAAYSLSSAFCSSSRTKWAREA